VANVRCSQRMRLLAHRFGYTAALEHLPVECTAIPSKADAAKSGRWSEAELVFGDVNMTVDQLAGLPRLKGDALAVVAVGGQGDAAEIEAAGGPTL
jgi:hypothetical protein